MQWGIEDEDRTESTSCFNDFEVQNSILECAAVHIFLSIAYLNIKTEISIGKSRNIRSFEVLERL